MDEANIEMQDKLLGEAKAKLSRLKFYIGLGCILIGIIIMAMIMLSR